MTSVFFQFVKIFFVFLESYGRLSWLISAFERPLTSVSYRSDSYRNQLPAAVLAFDRKNPTMKRLLSETSKYSTSTVQIFELTKPDFRGFLFL